MIGCDDEKVARDIYNKIGTKIRFKSEEDQGIVPFEFIGFVEDYNGVDTKQTNSYTEMSCG